jgi:hypothetical protein
MLDRYILDGKKIVLCPDLTEWVRWMDTAIERHVARDVLNGVLISTVFLGRPLFKFDDGATLFFETMVFGEPADNYLRRCSTYDQAVAMHRRIVEEIREMQDESALAIGRASGAMAGE